MRVLNKRKKKVPSIKKMPVRVGSRKRSPKRSPKRSSRHRSVSSRLHLRLYGAAQGELSRQIDELSRQIDELERQIDELVKSKNSLGRDLVKLEQEEETARKNSLQKIRAEFQPRKDRVEEAKADLDTKLTSLESRKKELREKLSKSKFDKIETFTTDEQGRLLDRYSLAHTDRVVELVNGTTVETLKELVEYGFSLPLNVIKQLDSEHQEVMTLPKHMVDFMAGKGPANIRHWGRELYSKFGSLEPHHKRTFYKLYKLPTYYAPPTRPVQHS